jgi:recombination protein RecT
MSNLSKKPSDLKSLINSDLMREQFARALPQHLSVERFTRIATTALTRTPKLLECSQESFMKCLLDLSAAGLEPDGVHAYLIPYGREATLLISYKGLINLVRRSGDVTAIRAETVCEADDFSWTNGVVHHSVDFRSPRGAVQAVYAEAKLASGEVQTAVMTREEVEAIRKRSKAGQSGPWVTDWSEMAKKTAVRRLVKMLPISSEILSAASRDDDHQFASTGMRNATPGPKPRFLSRPANDAEIEVEPEQEVSHD